MTAHEPFEFGGGDTYDEDDPDAGDPLFGSTGVVPVGSMSITTNVGPGERVGVSLLARGEGPGDKYAQGQYRVVLDGEVVSERSVQVRGGLNRRVEMPSFQAPGERGEYQLTLSANGQVLEQESLLVGGVANDGDPGVVDGGSGDSSGEYDAPSDVPGVARPFTDEDLEAIGQARIQMPSRVPSRFVDYIREQVTGGDSTSGGGPDPPATTDPEPDPSPGDSSGDSSGGLSLAPVAAIVGLGALAWGVLA